MSAAASKTDTKWLKTYGGVFIEKKDVQSCGVSEWSGNVFMVSCKTTDQRIINMLPIPTTWHNAAEYLDDIHKQLNDKH